MAKDEVYAKHILDAIYAIEKFIGHINYKKFASNYLVQSAVVRQLEIIGEASARLSKEFKIQHKNVPWQDIVGMRNRLIHEYFGVDIEAVWQTIKEDLPFLKKELAKYAKLH